MTKIRFIKNFWSKGTIYSPSSEHPQHPAEDTQDDTKTLFWRTAIGEDDNENIKNDLLTNQEANFIALLNHNVTSGNTLLQFVGSSTSDFSSGNVYRNLTHNNNNLFDFFTYVNNRYFRLTIQDASNPDNYLKIGTLILGKYIEPNFSFTKGYEQGVFDPSEFEFSDAMVMHSQEKPPLRVWNLPFKGLTESSKDDIVSLLTECGTHKAFVVCFDYNSPNSNSYLVRNKEIALPRYVHYDNWSWNAILEEVL